MEDTQILPPPPFKKRYITRHPLSCFDVYRLQGDDINPYYFYVELNEELSRKICLKVKPATEPLSKEQKDRIFNYLARNGNPAFTSLESVEKCLRDLSGHFEEIS